ncbi:hypothetical protein [Streptomyces prasinopilosus]|uniref:hypothetical protein n=1 Tax=Streptomyces prasinopilosus TaxID=67344 RepID=UPI000A923379|nr:hypothetical protein [Streptomyces prasinopilosus]
MTGGPVRVAPVRKLASACLHSALHPEEVGWRAAVTARDEDPAPLGKLRTE